MNDSPISGAGLSGRDLYWSFKDDPSFSPPAGTDSPVSHQGQLSGGAAMKYFVELDTDCADVFQLARLNPIHGTRQNSQWVWSLNGDCYSLEGVQDESGYIVEIDADEVLC